MERGEGRMGEEERERGRGKEGFQRLLEGSQNCYVAVKLVRTRGGWKEGRRVRGRGHRRRALEAF